jgi:Holliday junction resolvase RusA-like endonuclease
VAEKAREFMKGDPPLVGPVLVEAEFVFPRPKSHYRTGKFERELREEAPVYHTNMPDLDKLQRAIGDALAHTILRDDKQIAAWHVRKLYGNQPHAELWIVRLPVNGHALRKP